MATACLIDGVQAFLEASAHEAQAYQEWGRILEEMRDPANVAIDVRIRPENEAEQTVSLPPAALRLLAYILNQMSQGNGVSLIPMHAELTTTEAARVLKVSRPFLIGLLEKGEIPFRMTGTHRRILWRDLMAYKQKNEQDRLDALEELSALDQEYGLR